VPVDASCEQQTRKVAKNAPRRAIIEDLHRRRAAEKQHIQRAASRVMYAPVRHPPEKKRVDDSLLLWFLVPMRLRDVSRWLRSIRFIFLLLAGIVLLACVGHDNAKQPAIDTTASSIRLTPLWQSGATNTSITIAWDFESFHSTAMRVDVYVDSSTTPTIACDVTASGVSGGCQTGSVQLTGFAACTAHTITAKPCTYSGSTCFFSGDDASTNASTIGTSTSPPPAALANTPNDFFATNRWIYEVGSGVQSVPDATIFKDASLAVVRGAVKTRGGDPVVCGRVSVVGHPKYGTATTLWDGTFALAVNGTSPVLVDIQGPVSATLLPVQRRVVPRVHDYAWIDEARLTPYAGSGTAVTSSNRFVMGSPETSPGETVSRTLAAYFPVGTQATVNGTTTLTTFSVRPVEYTVGPGGPAAMPGELPPSSAYTFAASFELAGHERKPVVFDRDIVLYVTNWAGVPVGKTVPNGSYDESRGLWLPETKSGRVIRIIGRTGTRANVVTIAGGTVADNTGLTDPERDELGANKPDGFPRFPDGTELWRFEVNHFTSFDWNFALRLLSGVLPPGLLNLLNGDTTKPSCGKGSLIECENQTLGEQLELAGTPFFLNYSSSRQPGRWREIRGSVEKPAGAPIKRVEVFANVAGQHLTSSVVEVVREGKTYYYFGFRWDGRDLAGRIIYGRQRAHIQVGFVYPAEYMTVTSFGDPAASSLDTAALSFSSDDKRKEATIYREADAWVDAWGDSIQRLGGWSLSPVHYYDAESETLFRGDGTAVHAETPNATIETVAGGGGSTPANGLLARDISLPYDVTALTVAPDRSIYYSTTDAVSLGGGVWRIQPSSADAVDGFKAATVSRVVPAATHGIAVDARENIYYSAQDTNRVYRFEIATSTSIAVAGTGSPGAGLDGAAVASALHDPRDLSILPDGTLYVVDDFNKRVRKITFGPVASIQTVAGGGTATTGPVKATDLFLPNINGIAARPNGDLFIATQSLIWKVTPDGYAREIAGGGSSMSPSDGSSPTAASFSSIRRIAIGPDGTLFFAHWDTNCRVYRIDADIFLRVVAGTGTCATTTTDGARAVDSTVQKPAALTIDNRGDLFVGNQGASGTASTQRILRISTGLRTALIGGERHVPSSDGTETYVFDSRGIIQRTLDAFTGRRKLNFFYSVSDSTLLTSIQDGNGNTVSINRPSFGVVEIVSQDLLKSKLTISGGYLTQFEDPAHNDPASRFSTFTYLPNGLMTDYRDVIANATGGAGYRFEYDGDGRLRSDYHPMSPGAPQSLSRTTDPLGWQVAITSAGGRTTTYDTHLDPLGSLVRSRTINDGSSTATSTVTEDFAGRSISQTTPYGSSATWKFTPDPRFGQLASYTSEYQVQASSTRSATTSLVRTVDPPNATAPGAATSVTDTYSWSEESGSRLMTLTTSKVSSTSGMLVRLQRPSGARVDFEYVPRDPMSLDATDRLTRVRTQGLADVYIGYDARGRVTAMQQGSVCPPFSNIHAPADCTAGPSAVPAGCRRTSFGFDAVTGYLACAFDGLGLLERRTTDKLGRITALTTPYGESGSTALTRTMSLSYASNGTVSATVPVSVYYSGAATAVHTFRVDRSARRIEYEAPLVWPTPVKPALELGLDLEPTRRTSVEPWAVIDSYHYGAALRPYYATFGSSDTAAGYFGTYHIYQADGRLSFVQKGRNYWSDWDSAASFIYDSAIPNETITYIQPAGVPMLTGDVTRTFDSRLRLATQSLSLAGSSTSVSYGYDGDGQIKTATWGGTALTIERLYPDGTTARADGAVSRVLVAGTTETFARSEFGEVSAGSSGWGHEAKLGTTTYLGFTYDHDARGRVTRVMETVAAAGGGGPPARTQTICYTYRHDGGLESAVIRSGVSCTGGTVLATRSYSYDINGNRLLPPWIAVDEDPTRFDEQDRLLSGYDGYSVEHDRDGRLRVPPYSATTTYDYDAQGALSKITNGWYPITYRNDVFGRRLSRQTVGITGSTSWVYEDGALQPIGEYDDTSFSGTIVSRFVYASRPNVPDFIIRNGKVYRVFSDHLGSPRLVIDTTPGAAQVVVQRTDYDEWGLVTTDWAASGFRPIPFGFAGGLYDRATGLLHFGARDYDPRLGRWLTKDPAGFGGGGSNFYSYAFNDPVNYIDLDGRMPFLVVLVPILEEAAFNALLAGGAEMIMQMAEHKGGCTDWAGVGRAMAFGSVGGLVGGGGKGGGFGSGRAPHVANVTVYRDGYIGLADTLVSGGLTAEEKALHSSWIQRSLSTHTEARAARIPLMPGDTMIIEGSYRPCPMCKYRMRTAAEKSGAEIHYLWDDKIKSYGGK